ncbi:MAG: ribosome assembly RNA-binding protein YhbY [Gammaproteobacteria bacterium]|jgi:RNA-binding protein
MKFSNAFKKELRKKAHELHPIVIIGDKGLTEAVQLEIERGLLDHELIKIKIANNDRSERKNIIAKICQDRNAELIQAIGKIAVIYRKNKD